MEVQNEDVEGKYDLYSEILMPNQQTYRLLATLMPILQANGFRVGTGQQLRLQHLMEQLPDDIEPNLLKTRLAPIFAKNREEQQLFYELFENVKQNLSLKENITQQTTKKTKSRYWKWLWIVGTVLLIVLGFILQLMINPPKVKYAYLEQSIYAISKTIFKGDTVTFPINTDFRAASELKENRYMRNQEVSYTFCNNHWERESNRRVGTYSLDSTGHLTFMAQDTGAIELCVAMAFQHSDGLETILDTVFVEIDVVEKNIEDMETSNESIVSPNDNSKENKPSEAPKTPEVAKLLELPLIDRSIATLEVPQANNWTKAYYHFEYEWKEWTKNNRFWITIVYGLLTLLGCIYYFTSVKKRLRFQKAILKIPFKTSLTDYKQSIKELAKTDENAAYDKLLTDLHANAKQKLISIRTNSTIKRNDNLSNQPNYQQTENPFETETNKGRKIDFSEKNEAIKPDESIYEDPFENYVFQEELLLFTEALTEEDIPQMVLENPIEINFNPILNLIVPIISIGLAVAAFLILLILFHLKFIVSLLIALLLWVIIQYIDDNRKIVAELDSTQKPPFVWNIQVPNEYKIVYNEYFYMALNQMRQRTEDQFYRLSIPETVKSTIQSGGQIRFRYTQQTRPPEYLMLIDRRSGANHRAALFNSLFEAFRNNDVIIERFYFDSDIRLVFNESVPHGVKLKDLKYRFQNARLLILSDGYNLLNARNGKLAKWTKILSAWKDKAILTPNVPSNWGRKERRLAEQFVVLPATIKGFQYVVEEFENTEPADFSKWQKIRATNLEKIVFKGDLLQTLRFYYAKGEDKRLIKWIAACAIYPMINWNLTLSIGKLLAEKTDDLELLSLDNLLAINRLPWFVEGKIPQQVRQELVEYLEQNDAEWLEEIRQHLHELLQNNPPPNDSVAYEDYQMNVVINELMMKNHHKEKQRALEDRFRKMIEQGIEPDVTVLKYLDRPQNALDFYVPNSWKKYVFNDGKPFMKRKGWTWAVPIWLVLSTLLMSYQPSIPICENVEVSYKGAKLCLDGFEDDVLLKEFQVLDFIENKQYKKADSLITIVQDWFENDVKKELNSKGRLLYKDKNNQPFSMDSVSFFKNTSIAYFNEGILFYNKANVSQSRSLPKYFDQIWSDSACYFFQKAVNIDTTNTPVQEMIEQCNTKEKVKEEIFKLSGKVRDSKTKKPLFGVRVRTSFGLGTYGISTDKEGKFVLKLDNKPISELTISFQKENYKFERITIKLNGKSKQLPTVNLKRLAVTVPKPQQTIKDSILIKQENYPKLNNTQQQNPTRQESPNKGKLPDDYPPQRSIPKIHIPSTVPVRGGTFYMGSNKDSHKDNPRHQVSLSNYRIGKYEVTNKEFLDFVNDKGITKDENVFLDAKKERDIARIYQKNGVWKIEKHYENHPVVGITWEGAIAYCEWLSEKTEKTYRLPTEAEWEFAARGGFSSQFLYAGSNDLKSVAWYAENAKNTYPVGLKKANSLGLHDMSGNVWEWCNDWYHKNTYLNTNDKKPILNPKGAIKGKVKIVRGGSFDEKESKCNVYYRAYRLVNLKQKDCGFRIVLEE